MTPIERIGVLARRARSIARDAASAANGIDAIAADNGIDRLSVAHLDIYANGLVRLVKAIREAIKQASDEADR